MSAAIRPGTLSHDAVPTRVNIYVTKEVAFDLDKMIQVTRNVLKRVGCDNCHSGRILDFHIMEDFVVNPKSLEITEVAPSIRA